MKKNMLSILLGIFLCCTYNVFATESNIAVYDEIFVYGNGANITYTADALRVIGSESYRMGYDTPDETLYIKNECVVEIVDITDIMIYLVEDNISLEEAYIGDTWDIDYIDGQYFILSRIMGGNITKKELKEGTYVFRFESGGSFSDCRVVVGDGVYKGDISITYNGNPLKLKNAPIVKNNRTLVPIRDICEQMGMNVEWNEELSVITISGNENTIQMSIGNNFILTNGILLYSDVAPEIINNRTMIPIRIFAEAVGAQVNWVEETKTINIIYNLK